MHHRDADAVVEILAERPLADRALQVPVGRPEALQHVEPQSVGKLEVEHHHVRPFPGRRLQRLLAGRGAHELVPGVLQERAHAPEHVGIVVHQEDRVSHAPFRGTNTRSAPGRIRAVNGVVPAASPSAWTARAGSIRTVISRPRA